MGLPSAERWSWLALVACVTATWVQRGLEPWVEAGPGQPIGETWEARPAPGASVGPDGLDHRALADPHGRSVLALPVVLPPAAGWRFAADVTLSAPAERARLFVSARAGDEVRWFPSRPIRPGTSRVVVDAPSLAGEVEVGALLVGRGPSLALGEVALTPIRRAVGPTLLRAASIAGWVALALAVALRVARAEARSVLLALGLAVSIGVGMPREWLDAVLLSIPGARPEDLSAELLVRPTLPVVLQKVVGHGGGFGLLGFVACRAGAAPAAVFARLVGFAVATESLQLYLPSRSAQPLDVALAMLIARAAPRAPPGSSASPT